MRPAGASLELQGLQRRCDPGKEGGKEGGTKCTQDRVAMPLYSAYNLRKGVALLVVQEVEMGVARGSQTSMDKGRHLGVGARERYSFCVVLILFTFFCPYPIPR